MGKNEAVLEYLKQENKGFIRMAKRNMKKAYDEYLKEQDKLIERIAKKSGHKKEMIEEALQECWGPIYNDVRDDWENGLDEINSKICKKFDIFEIEHGDFIFMTCYRKPFVFHSFDDPEESFEIEPHYEIEELIKIIEIVTGAENKKGG